FQAEDGIRDATVTGVQTCALPICAGSYCIPWQVIAGWLQPAAVVWDSLRRLFYRSSGECFRQFGQIVQRENETRSTVKEPLPTRSEERRVGKNCRSGMGEKNYK